ncbi:MAG: hypothetical protein Q9191_005002 [Dirinaria sp. TL-2023a]
MADTNSKIKALLESNRKFAETWETPPTMRQMRAAQSETGGAPVVLTCLDPRCVPEQFFGPVARVPVIRNAGGRATKDAIASITVLRALARSSTVLVVHHTDCGMTHLTEESLRQEAKTRTPDAAAEIDTVDDYGCFEAADFEKTIEEDVLTLRRAKVLAGIDVRGLALDTVTGIVTELEIDTPLAIL